MPNAHLSFSQRWLPLLKVLLIPLSLHSCATGMRFTATLDALSRGAGPFETGAMLACISLFPAFFAVKVGRWLDKSGPSGPIHAALFAAAGSGLAALFLPKALFGIFSLFIACLLTGLAFMLMNTVTQRLTGDVCRPGDRQSAFTALSLVTASSNLATPVAAGYVIEHFSFSAFYIWCLIAPVILAAILSLPFMRGLLIKRERQRAKKAGEPKGSGSSLDFSTKDRKPSARDLPCGRSHKNVQHGICCFSGC